MIKIAYSHHIFAGQQYGGISRYFSEIATRISLSSGFSCNVIAPFHFNAYLEGTRYTVIGRKVPYVSEWGPFLRGVNNFISVPIYASTKPTLIHQTYYSDYGIAGGQVPIVLTVHDMIHEKFSDSFGALDPTISLKKKSVARADLIICISENTRKDLIDILNVPPEKTTTIYHGFELPAKSTESSSSKSNVLGNHPYILYVGSRNGYKNFFKLASAYASSEILRRELKIVTFGGGEFWRHEVQSLLDLGLEIGENVIQYFGDDAVLSNLYRNAFLFVYPSLYEGFGIPPLEAMSLGCPVTCSNTSSLPEIVGDAALLFDPYNTEAIRNSLETLVGSSELRRELVKRGKERIRLFSWDLCAQETLSLYKRLT